MKARIKNTIQHPVRGRLVCRIYNAAIDKMYKDNEGKIPFDKYTIAFKGYYISGYGMNYPYLASSEKPFSSQGFGQHCESKQFLTGKHLGKRVSFESLPSDVQKFILQSI